MAWASVVHLQLQPHLQALVGPELGWAGACWMDGGPLGRRCGPVKVGDYGAHAQAGLAGLASKQEFLGDVSGLGSQ